MRTDEVRHRDAQLRAIESIVGHRVYSPVSTENSAGLLAVSVQDSLLGLRSGVSMAPSQRRAFDAISRFDLSVVLRSLVVKNGMAPPWAEEAVFEFRRYLGMRAVYTEPIPMVSADVDEVWHTCILFTRLYATLCNQVFGQFLHHDPELVPTQDGKEAWRTFDKAYRPLFGAPGPLWLFWFPANG
jgi:hypothetical protein